MLLFPPPQFYYFPSSSSSSLLLFSLLLLLLILIVFPFPPHFDCFDRVDVGSKWGRCGVDVGSLLFSLLLLISIVFPPPPLHFYCFASSFSSSFLLFSLLLLLTLLTESLRSFLDRSGKRKRLCRHLQVPLICRSSSFLDGSALVNIRRKVLSSSVGFRKRMTSRSPWFICTSIVCFRLVWFLVKDFVPLFGSFLDWFQSIQTRRCHCLRLKDVLMFQASSYSAGKRTFQWMLLNNILWMAPDHQAVYLGDNYTLSLSLLKTCTV